MRKFDVENGGGGGGAREEGDSPSCYITQDQK